MTKTSSLIGSKTYASINSHNYLELSRRDDLESLGYMMIYLYLGTLSWQDISVLTTDKEDINEKIKQLKENIVDKNLPIVLVNYMNYVRKLDFNEKPNYYVIIDNFTKEIENMSLKIVKNI
jgi:hypothetical protein